MAGRFFDEWQVGDTVAAEARAKFAAIDPAWFAAQPLPHLQGWLEGLLVSDLFAAVMPKFAPWADGDSMLLFGSASVTPAKAGA